MDSRAFASLKSLLPSHTGPQAFRFSGTASRRPLTLVGLAPRMFFKIVHLLKTTLEIYGLNIEVQGASRKVHADLRHDFHYFRARWPQRPSCVFRIELKNENERPAGWVPLFRTKRSMIFLGRAGEQRIRFFDRAWVRYQFEAKQAQIFCDDPTIAYEVLYLALLSYVGESLDYRGIHRIHGLGMVLNDEGALLMAPGGTGKSTLAEKLLRARAIELLSDDTPLVSEGAVMYAFPQRIALKERPSSSTKEVRSFSRVQYGEKFVWGSRGFEQSVCSQAPVHWLLLASRAGKSEAKLESISRWGMIWPVTKWLVVGYETPQVWEFFLRPSARDLWKKSGIVFSRARSAWALLTRCQVARFHLSDDAEESMRVLRRFQTA
jgi:hypothetical protein